MTCPISVLFHTITVDETGKGAIIYKNECVLRRKTSVDMVSRPTDFRRDCHHFWNLSAKRTCRRFRTVRPETATFHIHWTAEERGQCLLAVVMTSNHFPQRLPCSRKSPVACDSMCC